MVQEGIQQDFKSLLLHNHRNLDNLLRMISSFLKCSLVYLTTHRTSLGISTKEFDITIKIQVLRGNFSSLLVLDLQYEVLVLVGRATLLIDYVANLKYGSIECYHNRVDVLSLLDYLMVALTTFVNHEVGTYTSSNKEGQQIHSLTSHVPAGYDLFVRQLLDIILMRAIVELSLTLWKGEASGWESCCRGRRLLSRKRKRRKGQGKRIQDEEIPANSSDWLMRFHLASQFNPKFSLHFLNDEDTAEYNRRKCPSGPRRQLEKITMW